MNRQPQHNAGALGLNGNNAEKEPSRIKKAFFPGKYIQGENALKELPGLIQLLGNKALILASPTTKTRILPRYDIANSSIVEFQGECCEKEIIRITEMIDRDRIDVVVGMGGGKTIDTAKIASDRAGIPVIIAPTIASSDAPCSGCAIIYTKEGCFGSVYLQKMNPQIVLVDTVIIANAPVRFLISGMGDALATWFEARSCDRTQSENCCGGYSTLAGLHIAKLCYETLLLYGPAAKTACENKTVTPALDHIVEANTLLSGIGFESSGLGAAHSIHNGLTALDETHAFYHGEKVAFGVLAGLHLTNADPAEMETVYAFCKEIGLPMTLSDIGVTNSDRNYLMKAAITACAPGETIHHEAGPITPEKVLNAITGADAMGRAKKQ
jgi:glycerol dehydrogenase